MIVSRLQSFSLALVPAALVCVGLSGCLLQLERDFDQDGDTFSVWEDCNDLDGSIHPLAIEACEDGIDQNCNGADLLCTQALDETESLTPTPVPTPESTATPDATPSGDDDGDDDDDDDDGPKEKNNNPKGSPKD